ncbi:hypothetical protein HSB1_46370 [Halogranum salarium B-1]|uniref:Uncharacterized protein n=1 Tax=Halogranum salarium B-1 TaxID=1210908 RepID=J3JD79_9EURY|nr:hypothetical protein HSB1_46370 [Halogranum salarium B-1]
MVHGRLGCSPCPASTRTEVATVDSSRCSTKLVVRRRDNEATERAWRLSL